MAAPLTGKRAEGQRIGEQIRKVLLNCDLRIVYSEGERKMYQEDYRVHSKIGGKKHLREAMQAKMAKECYRIYTNNLKNIRQEVMDGVMLVVNQYYKPEWRKIWLMHFLEQRTVDSIASEMHYDDRYVKEIIAKMREDVAEALGGK